MSWRVKIGNIVKRKVGFALIDRLKCPNKAVNHCFSCFFGFGSSCFKIIKHAGELSSGNCRLPYVLVVACSPKRYDDDGAMDTTSTVIILLYTLRNL